MVMDFQWNCGRWFLLVFKLRLRALIHRSVCRSVGLSVCLSDGLSVWRSVCRFSKNYKKNYKTLQNITKRYKTLQYIEIRSFCNPPPFQKGRQSRKLQQYARASLTESSFFNKFWIFCNHSEVFWTIWNHFIESILVYLGPFGCISVYLGQYHTNTVYLNIKSKNLNTESWLEGPISYGFTYFQTPSAILDEAGGEVLQAVRCCRR